MRRGLLHQTVAPQPVTEGQGETYVASSTSSMPSATATPSATTTTPRATTATPSATTMARAAKSKAGGLAKTWQFVPRTSLEKVMCGLEPGRPVPDDWRPVGHERDGYLVDRRHVGADDRADGPDEPLGSASGSDQQQPSGGGSGGNRGASPLPSDNSNISGMKPPKPRRPASSINKEWAPICSPMRPCPPTPPDAASPPRRHPSPSKPRPIARPSS